MDTTRETSSPVENESVDSSPVIMDPRKMRVGVLDSILENDDLGKPVEGVWHFARRGIDIPIRSLEPEVFSRANDQSRKLLRVGKTAQVHETTDAVMYQKTIVAQGVIQPNFNDAETRRKIASRANEEHRNGVFEVISLVFLAGEIADLTTAIAKLSGYGDDDLMSPNEATISNLKD